MKHSNLTMQKVWDLKILDVADKLQIKYSTRGAFRKCHCFMHDDKTPSMWFKLRNNTWSCPVCQKGGGIVSLVEEHENLKFDEAVDWLIREFNIYCYDDNEPYRPLKSSTRKSKPKMTCTTQTSAPIAEPINPKPSTINQGLLAECFSTESPFCKALVACNILSESQMLKAAKLYNLGITRDGGVIFWQIDEQQCIREGKIMFYQPDCHRDHQHNPSSVSSRLIKQGKLPKDWTTTHCLFGLHLVTKDCKVAIVESEKTAVICSEKLPEFTWLATGGKSNLTIESLLPLKGHKVIIFPDTDTDGSTYRSWFQVAEAASQSLGSHIYISNLLELHASEEQKKLKIDIADFLIENR